MDVADLFRAFLSLGLPVAALSWVLFSWIFSSGEIGRSEKRAAIKKQVKKTQISGWSAGENRTQTRF